MLKFIMMGSILILSISYKKSEPAKELRCIRYTHNASINSDPALLGDLCCDTSIIYYYDGMVLFELPYTYSISVKDKIPFSGKKYNYFAYAKGDAEGYWIKNNFALQNKWQTVDSFKKTNNFYLNRCNFYDNLKKFSMSLVSSTVSSNEDSLYEVHTVINKSDTSAKGTIRFYFSNTLKDIDISLCDELDKSKEMKLYNASATLVSSEECSKTCGMHSFEYIVAINEIPVLNKEKILNYFKMFADQKKKRRQTSQK